ncbi:MAG: flagellar hook assembly protein FlgD, partial [Bdellovibrionales bacterium]
LTQLQNQNPLDPVDTTEYTNQLVQYSALEQQIDTNLRLSNILDTLQVGSSLNAFAYVGNNVELLTEQTALQDGIADWNYALSGDADAVEITILNQNGTEIYQENLGGQSSGSYGFSFSADESSIPLAEGEALTIQINAKTNEGVDVGTQVSTTVRVSSIESASDGSIILRAGGLAFGIDDISKVLEENVAA